MKNLICSLGLATILTFAASAANAQLGIYGEYNATHIPGDTFMGTGTSWYQGGSAGLYYDVINAGPAHLGIDFRGGVARGNCHNYRNLLIGPRLSVKVPLMPLRPYIQGAIGVGGVEYNGIPASQTSYSNKLQYGVIAGLDSTIVPHIDLRIAEVQYLRTSTVSSDPNPPKPNIFTLGAGLVVRFP